MQLCYKTDAYLCYRVFGEEAGAIMRQTAEEEGSYISFLRLEHIDRLDICSFAVRVSEEKQYHVMVRGEWEGTAAGSGGSFVEYRAVVWDEKKEKFVWYPSFPEQAGDLELNEKRVIDSYMLGVPYEKISCHTVFIQCGSPVISFGINLL